MILLFYFRGECEKIKQTHIHKIQKRMTRKIVVDQFISAVFRNVLQSEPTLNDAVYNSIRH